MKKVVLKVNYFDDKVKQKAMKKVSGLEGVESISIDTKEKKMTITGDIDPVSLVSKLRKLCHTDILSVGPAKEPEKKKDDKKEDGGGKKDDGKKDGDGKKGGDDKKDEGKKKDGKEQDHVPIMRAFPAPMYYQPPPYQHYHQAPPPAAVPYYHQRSVEEDPNSCVIC